MTQINGFSIEKALPEDAEEIAAIYRSHIGSPGCTWDEHYPTLDFVKRDIEGNFLYKAVKDGVIVAAAYLGEYEERERIECFPRELQNMGELSRVGVKKGFQKTGVGTALVEFLKKEAPKLSYDGIGLLCGAENFSAMRLYEKCGFSRVGESFLYDTHWYCYCCRF